jgi:hypothetical protein
MFLLCFFLFTADLMMASEIMSPFLLCSTNTHTVVVLVDNLADLFSFLFSFNDFIEEAIMSKITRKKMSHI